jgi:hypothetical protein
MNQEINSRQFIRLIGVVILDVFLVWFGVRLLRADNSLTDIQMFLLGCGLTLWGVFMLSSNIPNKEIFTVSLVLVGFYYFARVAGIIERGWLIKLLGLASIAAAGLLLYTTIPRSNKDGP